MGRFYILNIGCKVNRVEADTAAAALIAEGWEQSTLEEADLVLVNTCTVTAEADKKCRKAVRRALARNQNARVVVTGCAAALNPSVFTDMDTRVDVVGRADLESRIREDHTPDQLIRIGEGFNTRVGIKVQDGCGNSCSYCIVHTARLIQTSLDHEKAIEQAQAYFRAGVNEIVLTGINIGAYDDGSMRLPGLMKEMLTCAERFATEASYGPRIRLSSIEPLDIDEELADLLEASEGRFCRHLHIPLQSGSTKVLAEMNRPYTAEWFVDMVARLRARVPSLSVSTDIIVGFPGETEEDFEETAAVARACGFSKIHVFPYSRRAGTPAAERSDQIAPEEKAERARKLREISDDLRREDFERRIGSEELALIEPGHALTESYHKIAAPHDSRVGELVCVRLDRTCMLQ